MLISNWGIIADCRPYLSGGYVHKMLMSMACTISSDLRPWMETLVAYTCWISLFNLRFKAGLAGPAPAARTARNKIGLDSRKRAAVQSEGSTTAGYLLNISPNVSWK